MALAKELDMYERSLGRAFSDCKIKGFCVDSESHSAIKTKKTNTLGNVIYLISGCSSFGLLS